MKVAIASTETITDIDGVAVRLWEGTTEQGVKCLVFVHRLAVRNSEDQGQFEQELQKMQMPQSQRFIPLSNLL